MAYRETYLCDVCGKERGATNHWFCVFIGLSWLVYTWDPEVVKNRTAKHYCGEECLGKALSQWVAEQSKEARV